MNLLVTGGAGFIGSNFVKYMLKTYKDYFICNLDKLTYAGNLENLKDVENNKNYKFIKGDIVNLELVNFLISEYKIDSIINFAAESHVDRSILSSEHFIHTNVKGTVNLLECVKINKNIRFVQVSTDEVYGSLGSKGVFTEKTPLMPNSPYSSSKASADLMCRAFTKTFALDILITRCSNNYGPYQFPEKLIPLMINNAINNKELPVYGDGKNIRDWIYVLDHCRAIDMVLHKGKSGEIYNIGANNEKENIEIVKIILEKLNKPYNLIKYVKDRPGHDRRYAIDSSKIRNELDWKPLTDFEEGINSTIIWYQENRQWIENLTSGAYQEYYKKVYEDKWMK